MGYALTTPPETTGHEQGITAMDLTTATPAEIDTLLSDIHERAAGPFGRLVAAKAEVAKIQKALDGYSGRHYYDARDLARVQEYVVKYTEQYNAIMAEAAPLNAEYTRRGGWTRAFLVLNTGGHVHSSTSCRTCFVTTRFGWLPEESGKDEAGIVERAGEAACTECYPTAPVASLSQPRRTFHKSEIEAQQARDERAAKAKAKAEKVAANTLDTPVRTERGEAITKVTQAKSFLTDGFGWNWDHSYYRPADRDAVAASLAEKTGETAEALLAAAAKRAAKRGY